MINLSMPEKALVFSSNSSAATRFLGGTLIKHLRPPCLIGLSGPLGSGKTEFVRGMLDTFGLGDIVSSPSFVLENVYEVGPAGVNAGLRALHHWDLYRVAHSFAGEDLADLITDTSRLVIVEWPERVAWINDCIDLRVMFDVVDDFNDGLESPRRLIFLSEGGLDLTGFADESASLDGVKRIEY